MMCLRLLLVMLIIISPSVSHALQVKEMTVSAVDRIRESKEAVRDDNSFSSKKELQVPSATKVEVSEEDKNTSEKSTKTGEIFFNTRKVSKNGDAAMIDRAVTSSKIESRNELKEDISKHNNFVAFSADYHPPRGHPGRNN